MEPLLVIGSGGHCRSVISLIKIIGSWDIKGIIDIKYKGLEEIIMGVKVIGGMESIEEFKNIKNFVIAVGDNTIRQKVVSKLPSKLFYPNLIHPSSFVDKSAEIGIGNMVNCFAYIGALAKLGDFNIINSNSTIEHEVSIGNYNHIAPSSTVCGRTELKDKIFLGAASVVLPNLNIASNTTIGANSTLIDSVKNFGNTLFGSPAIKK